MAAAVLAAPAPVNQAAVDRAFEAFWSADDREDAAARIPAIIKTEVSFDEALSRVRQGRAYDQDVGRRLQFGRVRTFDAIEHRYAFVVPETYEATRPHQVRVYLHGGVGRRRPTPVNRMQLVDQFAREQARRGGLSSTVEEIAVFPTGWAESLWWSATQADNLGRILDRLKRTYNVDENRVYLTGTSDGATGTYYMAFKDTTPWASFLPLIGDMTVLGSPAVRVADEMHPGNAVNKPFFIVSGGRDRLYPAHLVELHVGHLRKLGTQAVFRVYPDSDHSTAWWPEERVRFEQFVQDHPREPLPDRLSWETERTDRFNRAHWLVIDRLGAVDGESRLSDTNLLDYGVEQDFGLRINSAVSRGRRVFDVVAGSNAAEIGLRIGDTLVEIDGMPVVSGRDVAEAMQKWPIGGPVHFLVERSGRRLTLQGVFKPAEIRRPPVQIFPRRKPSGRVDLVRRGNDVEVSTHGVRAFTLLLSPSIFNFDLPVKVIANGRVVFDRIVEPSVATLLKWAARDNDRTMVFGAELNIALDRGGAGHPPSREALRRDSP